MKKSRRTVEQIIAILREVDGGKSIQKACREHNISPQTYHRWRRKYGQMELKDARAFKVMEKENSELKQLVADQLLKIRVLEAVNAKKW